MIWFKPYTLDMLQGVRNCNLAAHIGIDITEVGPDYLIGRMPVDQRTTQPFGILHGGASCVLSETLGSVRKVSSGLALDCTRSVSSHSA